MTKCEALKFLSTTHRHLHDERRRYEVKALFAYLTLNLAVAAALVTGKITVPTAQVNQFRVLVIAALAILGLICAVYLCVLHASNGRNIGAALWAERELLIESYTTRSQTPHGTEVVTTAIPSKLAEATGMTRDGIETDRAKERAKKNPARVVQLIAVLVVTFLVSVFVYFVKVPTGEDKTNAECTGAKFSVDVNWG